MSVSEGWVMGGIRLNHATTPVDITQLNSVNPAPNIRNTLLRGAGMPDVRWSGVGMCEPVVSITSPQVKTVIDTIGISGLPIGAEQTYTTVDLYFTQLQKGGTRQTGENYLKLTVNEGLWIPRVIRANQGGGPAQFNLDLITTYDGTNSPITASTSQSCALTTTASECFYLGPASINGTSLDGMQSLNLDFGLTEQVLSGDGQVYPTFSCIIERAPRIGFSSHLNSFLATIGIEGTAVTADDAVFYLRKGSEGGTRVAEETSEHISFTVDDGMVQPSATDYTQDPSAQSYDVVCAYDGSNDVIVIATTDAIS